MADPVDRLGGQHLATATHEKAALFERETDDPSASGL
jgi:hypothetical protein